jgi:hypothetical protein
MKLTLVCFKNKETTDERGSGVTREYDGGSSYDGHVDIIDTMASCYDGAFQVRMKVDYWGP